MKTPRFQPCPNAGNGVHRWLLSGANHCRIGGLPQSAAVAVIREGSAQCGRPVPQSEVEAAVRTAYRAPWVLPSRRHSIPTRGPQLQPKTWPEPDTALITKVTSAGFGLADLWEASPVRLEDNLGHTENIIDHLFPGDPLLCVAGKTPAGARTARRSEWRGQLEHSAFIVPSPMSSPTGNTKDGRESPRCLENVGPRRFLVVEFDSGDLDNQAACLLHLGGFAPLVVVVHSGNKSLHGWFLVEGEPEDRVRRFFHYALALGADPATWTSCQMVRMPDGLRDNERRQTVFFLSLKPLACHAKRPA
jgi:hypothetical protein